MCSHLGFCQYTFRPLTLPWATAIRTWPPYKLLLRTDTETRVIFKLIFVTSSWPSSCSPLSEAIEQLPAQANWSSGDVCWAWEVRAGCAPTGTWLRPVSRALSWQAEFQPIWSYDKIVRGLLISDSGTEQSRGKHPDQSPSRSHMQAAVLGSQGPCKMGMNITGQILMGVGAARFWASLCWLDWLTFEVCGETPLQCPLAHSFGGACPGECTTDILKLCLRWITPVPYPASLSRGAELTALWLLGEAQESVPVQRLRSTLPLLLWLLPVARPTAGASQIQMQGPTLLLWAETSKGS